jgi:hypothetical protein
MDNNENKFFFKSDKEKNNNGNILNRQSSFSRATNPNQNNNNNTYNQAASLMARHYTSDREDLDYKKTIPKSILIFIVCGILAFYIGPKYIITYSSKYMGNALTNVFTDLSKGNIDIYKLIMDTYIAGMLSFFMALFIYSGYNLIRRGYCLETFKEDTLKIFGCAIMICFLIALADQLFKIKIIKLIVKMLSFGGKIYTYSI